MKNGQKILDGNEAASYIAYKTNEVCAIYPITPSSAMGENCDDWATEGKTNIWGEVPRIIEMQSEGGAAGAVHGALLGGALTTTFTASQGLLLMIPDMFKIAGELNPFVLHVAARSIATHALSIFGDHSDVMAVRSTGFAMLFGNSVQEAMDMALIAQAATLKSRIPFINIFDGFRTSHELSRVSVIPDDVIREMIDEQDVVAHRGRCLDPSRPVIRGTAQNPDVFFQNREAVNSFYDDVPGTVQRVMNKFESLTGRKYRLFDYYGHPRADRVIVIMGSGAGAVEETVDYLNAKGEKTGLLKVRLYRPFSIPDFIAALPSSVKRISVLDRTKEPGAIGEPLYQDVFSAIAAEVFQNPLTFASTPRVTGGRYGLSSKEFTPAMVKSVFEEMEKMEPADHFTVGIRDDVTRRSLEYDPLFTLDRQHTFRGLFYGLGADGTVGANKNSIKIIGEETPNHVQGYFVYDSKKSGSVTISHLRFGSNPIRSSYLVSSANFIACHKFTFLEQVDVLQAAEPGSVFLLNAPYPKDEVWKQIPPHVQQQIADKKLKLFCINASKVARDSGMGSRTNTILQTCFFAISGILPPAEAIQKIKEAISKTYSAKGELVVKKNFAAVDQALSNLYEVHYPSVISPGDAAKKEYMEDAPAFTRTVLSEIMKGRGDELPVSALPADGTYPTATTQWEKRNIADFVPAWDKGLCTQCNKCVIICPHAAIRAKVYDRSAGGLPSVAAVGKEFNKETEVYTLQVSVEDCTGCNLCVEYCPAESKTEPGKKAINMVERLTVLEAERLNWEKFLSIPEIDRSRVNTASVKGSQFLQPLFEFSSACPGCGETPYLKLLTQLFGDRMVVANATGCSSIYGANLPTTPWSKNREGRGPAWANSLFEDNAEFGLGVRLAFNQKRTSALHALDRLRETVGSELAEAILQADESTESGIMAQRKNIQQLNDRLKGKDNREARNLLDLSENLGRKTVWIVGGDGWAYDIGFGGLDHVLSTGENVNVLVMDTEVYSNTGGQTSKATPAGAIARFSAGGKRSNKKNLGFMAISYKNVYVAQVALGANDTQTVRAIKEAEAYSGASLIIAYSHCIAHGYDMAKGAEQQQKAVKSGYWPLFRYNPLQPEGKKFVLDSKEPSIPLKDYIYNEGRYTSLLRQDPETAGVLLQEAENHIRDKWSTLKTMAGF